MTDRARLIEALSGSVPEKPTLEWPSPKPLGVPIAQVLNPFGRALRDGCDLNALLAGSPEKGNARLDLYVEQTRRDLALAAHGDVPVIYALYGANERWCTPMQYGGFYLEPDRELLSQAEADGLKVLLWVVGDPGTYLDFVSDLPAQAFGWDPAATGVSISEIRSMRSGLLFAPDPEADILLMSDTGGRTIAEFLTLEATHALV